LPAHPQSGFGLSISRMPTPVLNPAHQLLALLIIGLTVMLLSASRFR
jgi:hypothetical protein